MLKLAVNGACGRMGRRVIALAHEAGDFQLVAAVDAAGHPDLGRDAGELAGVGKLNVPVSDSFTMPSDVIIDFSLPAGVEKSAQYVIDHPTPLVVGATGLSDDQLKLLDLAAQNAPVVAGANMSLGVNLLFKLVAEVAAALPGAYDVEIVETHHRFKRDAPSGTAIELARRIAQARNLPFPDCLTHGRHGQEELRDDNTIGMHAVRAGDVVGEHSAFFTTLGEQIELRHRAHSRDTFVRGALLAARWLAPQSPGRYGMADVLGL